MSYRNKIKNWEGFANTDPLWSILTDPSKKNGKWDIDEFFKTGEEEMSTIFDLLASEQWMPTDKSSALDFGCGVGRLTRALSNRFDHATGIDASAQMVHLAQEYHQDNNGISFQVNQTDHLEIVDSESISFIYTAIVLQHIPVDASYNFISEFCRILKKGGTLVFQIPTADLRQLSLLEKFRVWLKPRERLANLGLWKKYHMDMNVYSPEKINQIVHSHNCKIVGTRFTNHTDKAFNGGIRFLSEDEAKDFVSTLFVIQK